MNNSTSFSTTMGAHIFPSDRIISYVADGTVCQFSFPFIVWEQGGIMVYLADGQSDPSSYSVTGLGSDTGGMVTFSTPPPAGTTVSILGNTPRERAVDYNDYVTLRAATMNLDANYQEAQVQENTRQLKRSLLTPPSDGIPEHPMDLPTREERKNSYLAFDGEGNPVAMGDSANLVRGMRDEGTTPGAVMTWKDGTGLQADDSKRIFGQPDGAATLNSEGLVPDTQLPPRGHALWNDGSPIPYRKNLNFSDEFVLADGETATNVATAIHVTDLGDGIAPLGQYGGHGEIVARTLVGKDNTVLRIGPRGEIEISSSYAPKEYVYNFSSSTWDSDNQIIIPPAQHGLGNDGHLIVTVRAAEGDDVLCNVNVAADGVITLSTAVPFSGMVMVYGGSAATAANMVNPMTAKGDIIFSQATGGTPQRLPIGNQGQVLTVGDEGIPAYKTLGTAAWLNTNIPAGAVQLNEDGEIPSSLLPINSLTYKGTFGSSTSSTGGDLPTTGVLDGDLYIADSDYSSQVAGKSFLTGQWAIFNGTAWDVIPLQGGTGVPAGTVTAYAGNAVPQGYLPCNGYTLARADYPYLFSAIGTLYNSGQEDEDHFSIPNYNSERRFLQGNTSAANKSDPGLPDIYGTFGVDNNTGAVTSGAFWISRYGVAGAGGNSGNDFEASFRASRYNPIYGASNTVQPSAQDVIFIIKYK